MSGVNKVILLGRLGKDPELRVTEKSKIVNFSIATSEHYKDKDSGERKEITEWHNVVAFGQVADIISKFLKKGELTYLEGKLRHRSYEKEGVKRYVTEVVVDNVNLLGSKPKAEERTDQNSYSAAPAPVENNATTSDDLPF